MPLVPVLTTGRDLQTAEINELALNTTLYYAADLSYTALDIGLSSALFGILTSLVLVAVIFLTRKGLSHRPVRILLPSTIILYGSTALYMASLASHIASVNHLVSEAQAGLYSTTFTDAEIEAFHGDTLKQSWMMTAALGINVLIGDSIVWWRACAVWKHNVVYCLGPLLIILTFAFGVKDLSGVHQCTSPCRQPEMLSPGTGYTYACAVFSLAVNMIATVLIGYKAWAHRRLLRGHFGHGQRKSQVMKALALLVESGTIYCLLLIVMVVYEVSPAEFPSPEVNQSAPLRVVADYTYACFIPIIAIYPVLIIVIVALNWSPIEHGGLTDSSDVTTRLATDTDFSFPRRRRQLDLGRATTMSTIVVMTDLGHSQCGQGREDGVSEAEAKHTSLMDAV